MSTPTSPYQVTRGHQTVGDDVVIIRPTLRTAHDWARALVYELSKDVELASHLATMAIAVKAGDPTGAQREGKIARLQVALLRATKVELYSDEADVVADDIHDAMVPLPPCDAEGCDQPEHHQGLCWDHALAQQVAVDAKTTKAVTA